jgi:hypothetical protein
LVALGALLAVIGVAIWQLVIKPKEVEAGSAPTMQRSTEASDEVRLRVTAFPATAKIYIDEELMPSNPVSKTFKKDQQEHKLVAKCPGFDDEIRVISFGENSDIVLTLTAVTAPKSDAGDTEASEDDDKDAGDKQKHRPASRWYPPRPKATATAAAPPPKPEPKKPDCSPPYVIDSRGVKKFKPQCL